jgi:hypothetical protein
MSGNPDNGSQILETSLRLLAMLLLSSPFGILETDVYSSRTM